MPRGDSCGFCSTQQAGQGGRDFCVESRALAPAFASTQAQSEPALASQALRAPGEGSCLWRQTSQLAFGRGPGEPGQGGFSLSSGEGLAAVPQGPPPAPSPLEYHITVPPGVSPAASAQPAHTKCSFWKSDYNFKVGLRSLHLVFRVPECCFIRITVLFFLGFSRRL